MGHMKIQASSLYLLRDDSVLFLVRNKKNDSVHKQGMFLPLGGKVESGERVEDGAIREAAEEAGVIVNSVDFRAVHYIRQQDGVHDDWVIFMFTSSDFTGEPKAGNEGHFEWVHWNDLKKKHKHMYGGDRLYMEYFRKYAFHVAEFTYDGFTFQDVKLLFTKDL